MLHDKLPSQVLQAVKLAIGPQTNYTLLHGPHIPTGAWDYVSDCLNTGWVSSAGAYVTQFEDELAKFTGAPS